MATLSKKRIQELKDLLEEKTGEEVSWEEAEESAYNLAAYAEICYDMAKEEWRREQKLKEHPRGFHLEGEGYTCFICSDTISNEETWYDKWGIKCLICQKAIDKKKVPASMAKYKDKWYSEYDLKSRFNIDRHAMNRLIKGGVLKPRTVLNEQGKKHAHLFLVKDHKDTLPPKELTKSRLIKEEKDGKDWHRSVPWYWFGGAEEVLEEYKIGKYLRLTREKDKTDYEN